MNGMSGNIKQMRLGLTTLTQERTELLFEGLQYIYQMKWSRITLSAFVDYLYLDENWLADRACKFLSKLIFPSLFSLGLGTQGNI
jgi:hypothetical protein